MFLNYVNTQCQLTLIHTQKKEIYFLSIWQTLMITLYWSFLNTLWRKVRGRQNCNEGIITSAGPTVYWCYAVRGRGANIPGLLPPLMFIGDMWSAGASTPLAKLVPKLFLRSTFFTKAWISNGGRCGFIKAILIFIHCWDSIQGPHDQILIQASVDPLIKLTLKGPELPKLILFPIRKVSFLVFKFSGFYS